MAHLLVTHETIIDQTQQENESRSIGKHKRGSHGDVGGLTCFEGSVWPGSDATKRRALVSITNQPNRISTNSNKPFNAAIQRKQTTFSTKSSYLSLVKRLATVFCTVESFLVFDLAANHIYTPAKFR